MNNLNSVIKSLGFTAIYWVDDDNTKLEDIETEKLLQELVRAIEKHGSDRLSTAIGKMPGNWRIPLVKLKERIGKNERLPDSQRVEDLTEIIEQALRALLEQSPDVRSDLTSFLSAIDGKLSEQERQALEEVFAPKATDEYTWHPLSFSDWGAQQEAILMKHDAERPALVLLDEQNSRDKSTLDGNQILASVYGNADRSSSFKFLVVTNTCTPAEEFQHAANLIRAIPRAPKGILSPLFAMSKSRISKAVNNDRIAPEFAEPIAVAEAADIRHRMSAALIDSPTAARPSPTTDIASVGPTNELVEQGAGSALEQDFFEFLARLKVSLLNQSLTEQARSILTKAMDSAFERLSSITLHEFMYAVTRSSQSEGISELDTLLRLIGVEQRAALLDHVQTNSKLLSTLKSIREIPVNVRKIDISNSDDLNKLRSREIYWPVGVVNKLMQPLTTGDIFVTGPTGAKRYFVLLANECDLMLRENGVRAANTLLLAEMTSAKADPRTGAALVYPLPEDGSLKAVYLNKFVSVPSDILDLCWTNVDGKCAWSTRKSYGLLHLLESQSARLESLKTLFSDKAYRARLALMNPFMLNTATSRGGRVDFNLSRLNRINAPYAQGLLTKMATVLSRPSYEHDFLPGAEKAA